MRAERPRLRLAAWLLLATAVLVQCWAFREFVRGEVLWAHPQHFDQVPTLLNAYDAQAFMRAYGPWDGLVRAFELPTFNGVALQVEAALLFRLTGPRRWAALAINWAHFMALQALVLGLLLRRGRVPAGLALLGVAALAGVRSPRWIMGGAADFRPDFAALCCFAAFVALAAASDTFASRGLALCAGGAAALCVATRFLTLAYFAGIFAALAAWLVWRWRAQTGPPAALAARRLGNLGLAASLLVIDLPLLLLHRHDVAEHYLRGILGPLAGMRAAQVGVAGPLGGIAHTVRSAVMAHLGFETVSMLGLALAGALAWRLYRRPRTSVVAEAPLALLLTSLAVPAAAQIVLTSKSPLVANVLVGPLIGLALVAIGWAAGSGPESEPQSRLLFAAGTLALALALYRQGEYLLGATPLTATREALLEEQRLHDRIAQVSRERAVDPVWIAVDHVSQGLVSGTVKVSLYERTGLWLDARPRSGYASGPVARDEAIAQVRASDFVVLTRAPAHVPSHQPFDRDLERLRPELAALCGREFDALGAFRSLGREVELYVRTARP